MVILIKFSVMDEYDFDDVEHCYQFAIDKIIGRKLVDVLLVRDNKLPRTPPASPRGVRGRNFLPLTITIPSNSSSPVPFSTPKNKLVQGN